ncbi:MAG: O-antigen ligase family protein [Synergistota bacterium]|nr:O-antigen ligase family protein [Synergistota bacterium]
MKAALNERNSTSIAPSRLIEGLLFTALVFPNLVFSGLWWHQTLHIMKWFVAMVPAALLCVLAGVNLALHGRKVRFRLDAFGAAWLFLLLFVMLQPLWTPVRSTPTFVREWFFLATLWVVYVAASNAFDDESLPVFLWGAAINGALNVVFAELQIYGLNGPFPFILPTPGNYIGNTGQQNMFGLWVAIGLFGLAFLFLISRKKTLHTWRRRLWTTGVLGLFAVLSWGLWNSTSRSAVLSLAVGVFFLGVMLRRRGDKGMAPRVLALALVIAATFGGTLLFGRGNAFVMKARDMVEHVQTIGKRDSIWATSGTMFLMHPVSGVGLGQFKWNYLDAQERMFKTFPDKDWKYTYWAHNEVLQWFCETGIFGGLALLALGAWWLWCWSRGVFSGKRFTNGAVWGASFLFMIWFNALWTRPFHRIEDALWMALAFGLANREILPDGGVLTTIRRGWIVRLLGAAMAAGAIAGLVFFGNGMIGDRQIRLATETKNATIQRRYLEKAQERLMVSDIAERQMAYHFIALARATKKGEYLAEGLNRLHACFLTEPHSREMNRLIHWYSSIKDKDRLESVARYLKPGSYRIDVSTPPPIQEDAVP